MGDVSHVSSPIMLLNTLCVHEIHREYGEYLFQKSFTCFGVKVVFSNMKYSHVSK